MEINTPSLRALRTGFSTAFRGQFDAVQAKRDRVATTVPSTTRSNTYGWMKNLSGMREWIGPRHVDNISQASYEIVNKTYEKTVGVDRDDINDDNLGQYSAIFSEMGQLAAETPEQLVWNALKNGFTAECFDGQPFFDTDHPIIGEDGETVGTYANTDGGAGTPWFLLYTGRYLKPLIFQERKKPQFDALDNPDDPNVFMNKQFLYGVDARWNTGYGFPQMAWGSKQTLNAANYKAARAAMGAFKGDGGRALGIVPNLLVYPPELEGNALEILNAERDAAGATNVWKGTAEGLMVAWLA